MTNTIIDSNDSELRDLDAGETAADAPNPGPAAPSPDYFVERNGVRFAGIHLLIDMWGAENLNSEPMIREALTRSTEACGAALLHIHLHRFVESGGISGVAVLAESHICIHTWPERGFAAVDIFMCGTCDPNGAIPVLEAYFRPQDMHVSERRRGIAR